MVSCLIAFLPPFVPFLAVGRGHGLGLAGIFKVGTADVGLFDGPATVNAGLAMLESLINRWEICQR